MNANELADALKSMETGWFDDLTLKEAATMLRQQQAEIEALKTLLEKGCLDSKSYVLGWDDGKSSICACGEPSALNTVHRKDSPCYVKEELTDEARDKTKNLLCNKSFIL